MNIKFSKEILLEVMKDKNISQNKLAIMVFNKQHPSIDNDYPTEEARFSGMKSYERNLSRYLKDEKISPQWLNEISEILNVAPSWFTDETTHYVMIDGKKIKLSYKAEPYLLEVNRYAASNSGQIFQWFLLATGWPIDEYNKAAKDPDLTEKISYCLTKFSQSLFEEIFILSKDKNQKKPINEQTNDEFYASLLETAEADRETDGIGSNVETADKVENDERQ